MTSVWLPKPTLSGDRVILRPFVAEDAAVMAALLADPELLKLTGSVASTEEALAFSPNLTPEVADWYATRSDADGRLDLALVDAENGQVVGEAVLNEYDAEAKSANFRILIGAAGRNRGLGSEATRLIVDYGFEHIGLATITLGVFAFNPRGIAVYEKNGFRVVGEDEPFEFDGVAVRDIKMAISRDEWTART